MIDNDNENITQLINRDDFEVLYFYYKGKRYIFSGWWVLDWDDEMKDDDSNCKEYDSKEEFLNDPFFDGKTIAEVESEINVYDYDLAP